MDCRGVLLIGAVVGAGALAFSSACSGPDPGAITFAERPSTGSSGEPQGQQGTSSGEADSGPSDPVFGTTTFSWVDPGIAANNASATHAGTVEGKDCMQIGCHLDGDKVFVFGGTFYSTPQGGATVPKGEVKIVGPDGAEIGKAYTDANGNFWVLNAEIKIPAGSKVAVRKEGSTLVTHMATALQPTDGACNKEGTCHGGTAGSIYAF